MGNTIKRMKNTILRVVMIGTIVFVLSSITASGQSGETFMLVAPVTTPGWGGENPAYLTPVLRFQFTGTGPLSPLSSIPAFPESSVNDPISVTFNSQGELFISNRHGNRWGLGSIARFTFDDNWNFVANGLITGNSLEAVHGLAFSPTGELFAANLFNTTISRFLFDAMGDAIPNGTIPTARANAGLAFAQNGELFTTHYSSEVQRFLFDPITGAAILNGSFIVPGASSFHMLAFSPKGELFIPDLGTDRVFRLLFDGLGNPVANGTIPVSGGPVGIAFSSDDELFVTSHFSGIISRFLFDESGNAIPNGIIPTGNNMGDTGIAPMTKVIKIGIDIKPGSFPNSINLKSKGNIPVAILSDSTFDATTLDQNTVLFAGTSPLSIGYSLEDVNGDGLQDVVLHFSTQNLNLQSGDTEACLTGKTLSTKSFKGCDSIRIVK